MKSLLTAGALALLAAGAANAAMTAPSQNANTPAYAAPVIADANAMKAADAMNHTNLRQQLQDQLTKAGYSSIKIMPSSFYVQAKDKKGEPVAMVIGPGLLRRSHRGEQPDRRRSASTRQAAGVRRTRPEK